MNKRLEAAYAAHRRAKDQVQNAEDRVNNFLSHLYVALKDRDRAFMQERTTQARLRKVRGY